jgi:capsular exopolysaccharide synthesis family protein
MAGLLGALRRRWLLALSLGVLGAAAAAGGVAVLVPPPKDAAHALLQIESHQPKVIFLTAENRADFATYQRTQAALLKSRLVLNAALREPKVKQLGMVGRESNPLQWLEKEIKVDFSIGPEFLRVTLQGDNPEELVVLVNAVTRAYLKEIVDKETKHRGDRLEKLQEIANKYEDLVKAKRGDLRKLAKAVGSGESKTLVFQQRLGVEQLGLVQKEMLQLQSELRKLEVEALLERAREKNIDNLVIPRSVVEAQVNKEPAVARVLAQIEQLEENIEGIKKASKPRAAQLILTRNGTLAQLRSARASLAERRKKLTPVVVARLREEVRKETQVSVGKLEDQLAMKNKLGELLRSEAARLEKANRGLGETTLDLEAIRDEMARIDRVAKTVSGEVEALKVELTAPPRVSLFEEAVIAPASGSNKAALLPVGAGVGAFALVLFGVAWLEFRARRVNKVDEVVRGLGIRVVGALPALPDRSRGVADPDTPRDISYKRILTESVDAARTVLLHAARVESLRVVMVTSALGGEGKTSVASHLAISLARAGCRTLLIDGDLRSPAVHRIFGLPAEPGFSELLRDEVHQAEAVRPTEMANLSVLPAGAWDGAVIAALAQGKVGAVLGRVRDAYDFIVVDSAPVLPVADSLSIGQHVDGVIFSILRNVSRLTTVYAAHQRLATLGVRTLGAIVNGSGGDIYGDRYPSYGLMST